MLSQKQTSVLSQQQTSLLLQEQTCVLSQHTMLMSQKSQLWQCHNVQVADRRSGPKSSKMTQNGSRMVALSHYCTFVSFQQQTSVESQQQTSVLSQQETSLLSQDQTSVLSQHTMLMSQKSQLWQCHNVQVADIRSGPRSAKMARNGSRMVARS